jgi:hypothetical protein
MEFQFDNEAEYKANRLEIISRGVHSIKIMALDGKPHWIPIEDFGDLLINFQLGEVWYRFKPDGLLHTDWTFVPMAQVYGIQFKTPKNEHQTHHHETGMPD